MENGSASNNQNRVQLGCGTLIIIALIVMIFSKGRGNDDLKEKLDEMNKRLDRIEQKIDALPPANRGE